MEIKYKDDKYSFTIKDKEINGIIVKDLDLIKNILSFNNEESFMINKKKLTENELNDLKKKTSYVKRYIEKEDYYLTCYDLLIREIKQKGLELKNPDKKIIDSLKIVGLKKELLNRRIYTISSSEKKLLLLGISLLSNPNLIIIEEPFTNIDLKNEKKMILLFQKIKDQYNKTIIFISKSPEKIYQYTSHVIILNNKVICEGTSDEVFKKVDILKDNKFEIPEIVEFTYLVRDRKKVKIDYFKDIRDIIKDIYKHV